MSLFWINMWCLPVQNKSSLVLVLVQVFTNQTSSLYSYVLLHVFECMLKSFIFLLTGCAGHRLGLHRLHWSHDPFPSLTLLVRHVLPNAGQSGAGQHVWHYPGHPHPHCGYLQSTKGIPHRSATPKSSYGEKAASFSSYLLTFQNIADLYLIHLWSLYGRFAWILKLIKY